MTEDLVFDMLDRAYITTVRIKFLGKFLPELIKSLTLKTALDAGCGVGYFSRYLKDLGLEVVAFDARAENITESQKRHPDINFMLYNLEDPKGQILGAFDLVFCLGLLYHLENTFIAIRNLHTLTKKVLLIESMIIPEPSALMCLHDENNDRDQSLRGVAFYPTETCLIKMCYRAGFSFIYRFIDLPEQREFQTTFLRKKQRTFLIASKVFLNFSFLSIVTESVDVSDPWKTSWERVLSPVFRLMRFIRKPWPQKMQTVRFRIRKLWDFIFPSVPLPIRLPFGVWWLIYNDVCSDMILDGSFEKAGYQFVNCFLQPGMTVLDAGAHHGFYTLLAAKKVGPQGRVIAFEPSSRERKRLLLHLRINRCNNVQVDGVALGNYEGKADFFLVKARETVCNSLRPPKVNEPVSLTRVPVTKLDSYLYRYKIDRVDFIKMDVEGGELEVLKGARKLLQRRPRPIIYCEVEDRRTERWGYKAKEIIMCLHSHGYYWFRPLSEGNLEPIPIGQEDFNGNFVAVPQERIEQIGKLLKTTD